MGRFFVLGLKKEDYSQFFKCVSYHVNLFNHTSWIWMTIVTPFDRNKSVRNRCVIEAFGGVFVLSLEFHFLVVWGLLSKDWVISLPFFSLYYKSRKHSANTKFGAFLHAHVVDDVLCHAYVSVVINTQQIENGQSFKTAKASNHHVTVIE